MDLATTLHERFEQQADVRPRSIAVECNGIRLSYRELNGEANRLARRLIEDGAGESKLVLVQLERSCDIVVALLAVLKAGGAFMTEDAPSSLSRADAVITDVFSRSAVPGPRAVGSWEGRGSGRNLGSLARRDSLACVTGDRAWTHGSALGALEEVQKKMGLNARDGLFHAVPLEGSGAFECFLPLIAGGRLVLASKDELCVPEWLHEARHNSRCRFECIERPLQAA